MDSTATWAAKLAESNRRSPRRKRKPLAGRRFGRLRVVAYAGPTPKGATWRCVCDCGAGKIATTHRLTSGDVQSCGCLQREMRLRECERMRARQASRGGECLLAKLLGY